MNVDTKSPIVDRKAKKMIEAVSARIRSSAEGQGVNQAKLAGMTGMSKQVMSKYWNGHSAVKAERLFDIADAQAVSGRWLLTGEGSATPHIEAGEFEREAALTADASAWMTSFSTFTESKR